MEKMVMTNKLAEELMNVLACVAISAMGGLIENEDGSFDEQQMEYAERYAKKTYCELLEAWEELTGKEWKIRVEDEEE
jgi:hypothetical protein